MKRLKTFGIYLLIIVLFFIFSEILIFISLNTMYKNINVVGQIPTNIEIEIATATSVNGQIKGKINDDIDIKDKFLKFDFYSDMGTISASKFLKVSEIANKEFNFYFKLRNIKNYSVSIVNEEIEDSKEYNGLFSFENYKRYKIAYWALLLLIG